MKRIYHLFVKRGDEIIPVIVLSTWRTPVTHTMLSTVKALEGKPFTDGHHKYPCSRNTLTLPAAQVIIRSSYTLSHPEAAQLQKESEARHVRKI